MYVAADCTRSYSPEKLAYFTRQIVFLRPGTFVIFDRLSSKNPRFKKTWLLQAIKAPTGAVPNLIVTNGNGRLFIQTLLPRSPKVKLLTGSDLYSYGGKTYPPNRDTGPAPECRIEISPSRQTTVDYFLHVLTATDAGTASVEKAAAQVGDREVIVTVGRTRITFTTDEPAGRIEISGRRTKFANKIVAETNRSLQKYFLFATN